MTKTLQARFDGKVLIPESPVSLPTDRLLEVQVSDSPSEMKGSPQAILRVLEQLPQLSSEDIDELNRAINDGKQPISDTGVFDDEDTSR